MELNKIIRKAKSMGKDRLLYPRIEGEVMFVCWADAAWGNRKDGSSQAGHVLVAADTAILKGLASPCAIISWQSKKCPRVARSSGAAEVQAASEADSDLVYTKLFWAEILHGHFPLKEHLTYTREIKSALVVDAKGVYDAIARSESSALGMKDKHSAIEALALKQSLTENKTSLRWCHSEANIADALTKGNPIPLEVLREFVHRAKWKLVYDPSFTSSRKLKAAGKLVEPWEEQDKEDGPPNVEHAEQVSP